MALLYSLLYGIGYTPWEGHADYGPLPDVLSTRAPGRALDAGCGTGRHAVMLAEHGWEVVGVDAVATPLGRARARAEEAGVAARARFLRGDVADLSAVLADGRFDLIVDVGCMHGLAGAAKARYAAWLTGHTDPGADFVAAAALPRRGPGPKGIDHEAMARVLGPRWQSVDDVPADAGMGRGPLRGAAFRWHRFRRV